MCPYVGGLWEAYPRLCTGSLSAPDHRPGLEAGTPLPATTQRYRRLSGGLGGLAGEWQSASAPRLPGSTGRHPATCFTKWGGGWGLAPTTIPSSDGQLQVRPWCPWRRAQGQLGVPQGQGGGKPGLSRPSHCRPVHPPCRGPWESPGQQSTELDNCPPALRPLLQALLPPQPHTGQ